MSSKPQDAEVIDPVRHAGRAYFLLHGSFFNFSNRTVCIIKGDTILVKEG